VRASRLPAERTPLWIAVLEMLMTRLPVALLPLFLLCALHEIARADEPPSKPILRIETGMHTAPIRRISTDAAGRWMATASDDKTIRIWEVQSGQLIQTLRVPAGPGDEGRMYAVAVAPSGSIVAAAGWTSRQGATESIYLFDRVSGQMNSRVAGLPNIVNSLAFSADGTRLAAILGGRNGVQVYRISDGSLLWQDTKYEGDGFGVAFDRRGRLATTCLDGYIRLYDAAGNLLLKRKPLEGGQLLGVAWSPDGQKLATGLYDDPRVFVLSGETLDTLFEPDTHDIRGAFQDLHEVAWSSDGRTLVAGGKYSDDNGAQCIRRWDEAGRGAFSDTPAATSTIMDIQPLPDGALLFGAADPAWGILNAEGKRTRFVGSHIVDFRTGRSSFRISRDGLTIQFGYLLFGKEPARFSVVRRALDPAQVSEAAITPDTSRLAAPRVQASGLAVTDWENARTPKVNGIPVKLGVFETSRSLAISPDADRFLLGTEGYLHCFDKSGKELWYATAPGIAWSVNVSGDGRFGVAAFGDGTIRWYDMQSGAELLALFPHADRKRWVAWTPSGYFDCSPGAEDLIGWHINRERNQAADFFPASRFRDDFYRPDIIAQVLATSDEQQAIRAANQASGIKSHEVSIAQKLPPVVRIVAPTETIDFSEARLPIKFAVRSPGGEQITGLKILVDGRPVATRSLTSLDPATTQEREATTEVTLPERDCELSLVALSKNGASVPRGVRMAWKGQSIAALKPALYILAVGVSKYMDPSLRLSYSAKDAADFAAAMIAQKGGLYRDVTVRSLADSEATKDAVLDGLEWIQKQTTSRDVAMVFLSGHGITDPNGYYYYLPYNFDRERMKSTGVPFTEFTNTMGALAGKAIFFVDSCDSGNAGGRRTRGDSIDLTRIINELVSVENGTVVFAASTGKESALEDPAWGNGAFTKALLEGLGGKADYRKTGRITITLLDAYIAERVKELTGGRQHPTTTKPPSVPDFPVAISK